jgi:hypothetical protein
LENNQKGRKPLFSFQKRVGVKRNLSRLIALSTLGGQREAVGRAGPVRVAQFAQQVCARVALVKVVVVHAP